MKQGFKIFWWLLFLSLSMAAAGCTDKNAVLDKNVEVNNHNWVYLSKFAFDVSIEDANVPYNLFMNLRVSADYKYSNIFVLINQTGPDKKTDAKRYEFTLANKDGEWLGEGSGNLFSYQLPFETAYKFPAKGVYHFYIEQNMRDNPLREVSDVGLRVEKAK